MQQAVNLSSPYGTEIGVRRHSYHTNNTCSHISPENATTGVVAFPVCADCARASEARIVDTVLSELAASVAAAAFDAAPSD